MKPTLNPTSASLLGLSRLLVRGLCPAIIGFSPALWAQNETFSSSGTWTVPENVSSVIVECWGGGGAGGVAVCNGGNTRGGGGAGGSYARTILFDLVEGTEYQVVVGTGGISVTESATDNTTLPGQKGGDSRFTDSSFTTVFALAEGGAGGLNAVSAGSVANRNGGAGSAASNIGDPVHAGGNGGNAGGGATGPGGGGAGSMGPGGTVNNALTGGVGGSEGGGDGGAGVGQRTQGNPGLAPGGGGSGGGENRNGTSQVGGAGGDGRIVLTYEFDTGIVNYEVTGVSPQVVTDGAGFDVTITARDSEGQIPADSATNVTVSSPTFDSLMEFDWNGDGTFGDNSGTLVNGQKTIKARNKKAQTVEIVASSGFGGTTTTAIPLSVETTAGAFAKLQILAPGETAAPATSSGKAGSPDATAVENPFSVTVNAVDQFWNPVVSTLTPAFTSTDGAADLPDPVDALVGGTGDYTVIFFTPGNQTLTASGESFSDTTPNILVNALAVTWSGATDNKWDTATENWVEGLYGNNFAATFDDFGVEVQPTVELVGTLQPFSVNVNSTFNYSLGSTTGGSIGGAATLTKSNTGNLTLTAANNYSGSTTVNAGVLLLSAVNALPATSHLTLNGGVLGLGTGDFTRSLGTDPGQVNLSASNSGFAAYGANRVVNLGGESAPLSFGDPGFFSGVAGNPSIILSSPSATHTLDFQNPIVLVGIRFFNVPDGEADVDARLSGAITGSTSFSKAGDGTLELTNTDNAWTGFTFHDSGILLLGAANVLPSTNVEIKRASAAVTNPILDLNGFSDTIGGLILGSLTTGGTTPNEGQEVSIINSAGGAAALTLSGNVTYRAGTAEFENGQATISANLATGTTGNRVFTIGNGRADEDLVISGELTGGMITKLGVGTLVLSNPNYSGDTDVDLGTLIIRKVGTQTNANLSNDASTITIETGAILNLDYTGTDVVNALVIGANPPVANGTYSADDFPDSITGTGTITVESDPFVTWAGPGVDFDADANNDGVENGLAWLLGAANPNANATGLLPVVTQTAGSLKLTFDMLPSGARDGAKLFVEHSSNLGTWSTGVEVPDTTGGTAPVTFVVSGTNPLDVEATISSTEAVAGKLFGRLRAER